MQRTPSLLVPFLNFGHALDHVVVLIYPTVVLALSVEFNQPYGDLLPLSLGGFLAFGAGSLPAGWLGDHWSRRKMMAVFFFGVGIACLLTALANGPWQIAAGLTLIGAFAAIYHPVANAMLVADPARLGRVLGVNGLFGNLGVAFAALMAGALTQAISWRAAFVVPGVVGLIAGFLWLRMVPEIRVEKKTTAKVRLTDQFDHRVLVRLFAILMGSTVIGGVIFSATTIAMPKVFDERLHGLVDGTFGIGALVSVVYALAAFAQMCVGPLIDKMSMRGVFIPLALLQAPLLWLAGEVQGWPMFAAALAMMFVVFGQIPINDAMVARYTAEEFRARVYAVRYFVSFGASAAAIPLVAVLHEHQGGFQQVFTVLALLAAAMIVLAFWFPGQNRLER